MTPRQKRFIAALAIANSVVILALVVLVTHPSGTNPSPLPHTPMPSLPHSHTSTPPHTTHTPTPPHTHTPTPPQETCQWQATQLLAQAGMGGTVTLTPDGPLRFDIAYPLAPGQTADEAAQLVWTAFDISQALVEDECNPFTRVEVTVLTQGSLTDTQISASVSVSVADLVAFGAGELSEDEFIERVAYSTWSP